MNTFPPWNTPTRWREANGRLDKQIHTFRRRLRPVAEIADDILVLLANLNDAMDILGSVTCKFCPEPCCQTAKVWFDRKDLLLLHFTDQPIPPAQPIDTPAGTCRYLTPRGCRLPRPSRPFVCTWYLCPLQKRVSRRWLGGNIRLSDGLTAIQSARKQLEIRFNTLIST